MNKIYMQQKFSDLLKVTQEARAILKWSKYFIHPK